MVDTCCIVSCVDESSALALRITERVIHSVALLPEIWRVTIVRYLGVMHNLSAYYCTSREVVMSVANSDKKRRKSIS